MDKRILFFALTTALLLVLSACGQGGSQGYVLYQAIGQDGKPAPDLVMLDDTGKELRRIALPDNQAYPIPAEATLSSHALYRDSANEKWLLVDVTSGSVQQFIGFGQAQEFPRLCGSDVRWALLCGSKGLYLLNADTGQASEIPVEFDPASLVNLYVMSQVTRSGSHFLLWNATSRGVWLVPAAAPEQTRKLGPDESDLSAILSGDGDFVVYLDRTDAGDNHVVKEEIDGSADQVILSGPDIRSVTLMPGNDQLVIDRNVSVSLLSLDDLQERILFTFAGDLQTLLFNPDGKKAAYGVRGSPIDPVEWTYLDLVTGEQRPLDTLKGYVRGYGSGASRWQFITDGQPTSSSAHIASLDLQTGQVRPLLFLESLSFMPIASLSPDGRVGLVTAYSKTGETQVWLLLADQDGAQLLAESKGATGRLSPDGKWVVVATLEQAAGAVKTEVRLVPTGQGQEKLLGEGFMPVWVKP